MTLQELLNIIDKFELKHQDNNVKVNSTKDTRITRKALLDSNMSILAERDMYPMRIWNIPMIICSIEVGQLH